MKIGMISQWYEPETGSAAHPTAIARALAARGHDLKVLTGFPSYPRGRVYDGWRMRPRQLEVRDGVTVLRVPDVPSHNDSAARRAVSLVSFAASSAAQVSWLRDVDVCLTYLTPATVGMTARILKGMHGVPYVLYVQDLWPESVTASGFIASQAIEKSIESVLNGLLGRLYRRASSVVGTSPTMRDTLAERAPTTPVDVVYNWVDEETFAPTAPGSELPADRAWMMYAGGIGEVQGLETSIDALRLLADRPDIGLVFVGEGVASSSLCGKAKGLGLSDRVRFLGHREMSAMPSLMSEARAQLVSLRDLPVFRGTVPSKLQASMAAGQPVICAVAGDAAALTEAAGAGFVVPPGDDEALAAAFRIVADMSSDQLAVLSARSRSFYEKEMSAGVGAQRLEDLLIRAAESGAP